MKKMKTLTVCGQTFCVCDEGAVKHDEVQELTYEQRNTARNNIRALSWETDVLEPGQQARARANIGAASTMDTYGTVKYTEQELTGEQKQQAVENIQAVSYRPGQNLGADGRSAARQNIGAVSKAEALTAVEEKHFYEMGEPLVPETTVNCDLANSSGIYYSSISNKGAAIIEMKPETVVVVVNGEQHKLTVQYSHNPDGTVNSAYIGNRSFLGTGYADNGEDYLFSYSATTGSVAVMYSRTSGEKTFSIHVAGNVLADEYLNPLVIKAKPQALTAAMMQQARENIGAVGAKEAIEAVEDEFFEKGLSPIYPEETVPCVATAFNGGTVYKGTLSANGAEFYNANYEKVYVKIGSETVKCSVEYWTGDPGSKYAEIGNKHLRLSSAADTGEDFCIDYRLANGPSVIYTRAAGDVTFTVNTPAPVMKQEYLPPMGAADAVTYTAQTLTDEQKAQARENIGAAAVGEGGGEVGDITWDDIDVTYGDTLKWDGNTDGLPNFMGMAFKVSDAVPNVADVQKGGSCVMNGEWMEFPADTPEEELVMNGIMSLPVPVFVVPPEMAGVEVDGVMFPEAGTYFISADAAGGTVTELQLNGYNGFQVKEKIPKDRLPLTEIGGVANWDAADGEAGYILNRPFGHVHEVIFPETVFQVPANGEGAMLVPQKMPSNGGVYNVVWNGVTYECQGYDVGDGIIVMYYVNVPDTEPFSIMFSQGVCLATAKDGSTTVTLEIIGDYNKKIDSAFLPPVEKEETGVEPRRYGSETVGDNGAREYTIPQIDVDKYGRITNAGWGILRMARNDVAGLMSTAMFKYVSSGSHLRVKSDLITVGLQQTYELDNCDVIEIEDGGGETAPFPKVYAAYLYTYIEAARLYKRWVPLDQKDVLYYKRSSGGVWGQVIFPEAYRQYYEAGEKTAVVFLYETPPEF